MSRHGENMVEGKSGNKNNDQIRVVGHFCSTVCILFTEDIKSVPDSTYTIV